MQTSYNQYMSNSFAGMKGDARFDVVESAMAFLAVNYGRALVSFPGEADVHMAIRDVATLTASGAYVASNSTVITVNGAASAPVVYAVSSAATAAAVVAAIAAIPGVTSVSVDATNLIYTIRTKGVLATVSGVITLGATQATFTADNTTPQAANSIFMGASVHRNNEVGYTLAGEIVDVMRKGEVWVETTVAVNINDTAYVDMVNSSNAAAGQFTNVSTNNITTHGRFRSATTGAGLALLDLNLPQV